MKKLYESELKARAVLAKSIVFSTPKSPQKLKVKLQGGCVSSEVEDWADPIEFEMDVPVKDTGRPEVR